MRGLHRILRIITSSGAMVIWTAVMALVLLLVLEVGGRSYEYGARRLVSYFGKARTVKIDPRIEADGYADSAWAKDYWLEHATVKGGWTSYVYWRRKPFDGEFINIDNKGNRHSWNQVDENTQAAKPVRIFVFGGSTIWGTGARDLGTIPSHISRLLSRRVNRDLQVTNFGQSGYVSTQELFTLLLELRGGKYTGYSNLL